MLESLRGQQADNNSATSQDLQQQISGDQLDDQLENENMTTPTIGDDNLNSSSSSNEANSQQKEETLVVKIRDTSTGEVTTQKMQPDRVWSLETNKKIMVELNGDGQGSDNGSNLLLRFLGKLSQKSIFCPMSIERWDRMPEAKKRLQWQFIEEQKMGRPVCRSEVVLSTLLKKDGNYVNEEGKILADKISEHLPQDQEHAATLGVPLKILAHPNDAIGKVYGAEHSGRVRGLGGNVFPSAAFGMPRHSISHVNFGGSSNMPHQRVEVLEKHVETLEERLTGYEETKEQLVETKKRLTQNENHSTTLHRFLQAKFGSELPIFNLDSS